MIIDHEMVHSCYKTYKLQRRVISTHFGLIRVSEPAYVMKTLMKFPSHSQYCREHYYFIYVKGQQVQYVQNTLF
jgi:hypothetical protein